MAAQQHPNGGHWLEGEDGALECPNDHKPKRIYSEYQFPNGRVFIWRCDQCCVFGCDTNVLVRQGIHGITLGGAKKPKVVKEKTVGEQQFDFFKGKIEPYEPGKF